MSTARRTKNPVARARPPAVSALRLVGASLLTLAGVEIVMVLDGPTPAPWAAVVYVLLAVEYLLVGLLTWARRPGNRTGGLLCLCALAVLVSGLSNTSPPVLVGIGTIFGQGAVAVLVHLVLAFPSGVLPDRWSRLLCAAGYLITVVLLAPTYLFASADGVPGWIQLAERPELATTFDIVQRIVAVIAIGAVATLWVLRLRRARRDQFPALAFVSGYGVFTLLFLELSANIALIAGIGPLTLFIAQILVFAGVPLVFAVVIVRGGYARAGGVETLVAGLRIEDDRRTTLAEALAEALGDPSVELLFWLPDREAYVDADGAPAAPRTGSDRATMEVELGGRRIGMLGHDADLIADPSQLVSAVRVMALAMDRERLVAELLAGRTELQHSLTRIVEAGDLERRRLARDLHDGLQSQLIVLAVQAGRLAGDPAIDPRLAVDARAVRYSAETSIATLREVVHGILPALLVGRGLFAATEDLVDRLPLPASLDLPERRPRLPGAVETAGYFTVAEALSNAVKYAQASRLHVALRTTGGNLRIEIRDDGVGGADPGAGGGLQGIADRVEALGGRLRVHSPAGQGTVLTAEVPCES